MAKIAVIYWSMTGNTEAMADLIAEGVRENGGEAELFTAADFDASTISTYDAIAFGCPSMGVEELEDSEFAPMFDAVRPALAGKKIALFGSYDWGDGEWMRLWEESVNDDGAEVCGTVIANLYPDEDAAEECRALGKMLAAT